ncbi:hypothetical protein Tco_1314839 [Tanacetum coccineum]
MPPSFLTLSLNLCIGDPDLPCLIVEKTLVGSGLLDMLQERLDLRGWSGTLIGQRSAVIVIADVDHLPRMSADP